MSIIKTFSLCDSPLSFSHHLQGRRPLIGNNGGNMPHFLLHGNGAPSRKQQTLLNGRPHSNPRGFIQAQDFSSFSNSNNTPPKNPSFLKKTLQPHLRPVLKGLTYIISGATLLLSTAIPAAPYIVSQPAGLEACLGLVNGVVAKKAPGVKLKIDHVDASWGGPLSINNLQIIQQCNGDAGSGSTTKEGKQQQQQNVLAQVESIKTSSTLWQLAVSSRPTDVVIQKPQVYAVPDSDGHIALDVAAVKLGLSAKPHTLQHSRNDDFQNKNDGKVRTSKQQQQAKTEGGIHSEDNTKDNNSVVVVPMTSTIPWTGEYRKGNLHVSFVNGSAIVNEELRNVIGNDVHFEVLEGASLIQEESELNIDTTWTRTPPTHPLPRFAGTYDVPISIRLDSEFVSMQMEGWETTKKYRYMHKPVVASINLAEGNIRPLLQRLNPLLTDVVSVHSTSPLVKIKVSPAEALWPAEQLEVSMSPLNIGIGQGAVLRNALSVLTLADRGFTSLPKSVSLSLSPIHATLDQSGGNITAHRLDWNVDIPGKPTLHLVSWGNASSRKQGSINMTLCLPADTLERILGLDSQVMAQDTGVAFEVYGTSDNPQLKLGKASKAIAYLLTKQQAERVQTSTGFLPRWMATELSNTLKDDDNAIVQIPPLPSSLQAEDE